MVGQLHHLHELAVAEPGNGHEDRAGAKRFAEPFLRFTQVSRRFGYATFQTREVLDAMNADSGVPLTALKVDGGMVYNELLMQFQADILRVPVRRPAIVETTAFGAAGLAGLAVGFWESPEAFISAREAETVFSPSPKVENREDLLTGWRRAVGAAGDA